MSDDKRTPLLVVAADPGVRGRLERALADAPLAARALSPAALRDPARWIDAAAALAVLDAPRAERTLGELELLRGLPSGGALVLCVGDVPAALLERALARLAPQQVLPVSSPPPLLRYALERVLPAGPPGRGARSKQRRAPALLGVSAAIRGIIAQVRQIGPSDVPVLILGETGTGKELVARAIHQEGRRARGPFVAVNCGALPEALLESELFGYEPGAFTGAASRKTGLFEQADGGTLFLDEIGDTSPALQVKLLRALESGEVRPLGGSRSRRVDVRVVSATHRDLPAELEAGSFRQDLFYRLNAFTIYVPPLRRRPVDIPFLAQHFAEEFGAEHARATTLDEGFLAALSQHDFPGNVRELRNAVERAIALAAPSETVTERHLPPQLPVARAPWLGTNGTLRERVDQLEAHAIREALEQCGGNRTRAAERLGLSRLGLRKKMRRLGMEAPGA